MSYSRTSPHPSASFGMISPMIHLAFRSAAPGYPTSLCVHKLPRLIDSLHNISQRYESTGFTTIFLVCICNHWYWFPVSHHNRIGMHLLGTCSLHLPSYQYNQLSLFHPGVLSCIVLLSWQSSRQSTSDPIQQSLEQPATGFNSNPCDPTIVRLLPVPIRVNPSAWILSC